ncbi:PQQ-binding-like beta-propeller repeat protein [Actinomadura rudentiformis]|uniref:PQQ-binding-like beta-propeller repeat protein n=1 Tax=Actinomadura rudentiformis TaxID=359158 RepID=A0A6H9YTD3_9ACTN|nr:PQQ-binding-like beta-propeller repeat protein [Actinomadura rudentiformis]
MIYGATRSGTVLAVDAATGELRWILDLAGRIPCTRRTAWQRNSLRPHEHRRCGIALTGRLRARAVQRYQSPVVAEAESGWAVIAGLHRRRHGETAVLFPSNVLKAQYVQHLVHDG